MDCVRRKATGSQTTCSCTDDEMHQSSCLQERSMQRVARTSVARSSFRATWEEADRREIRRVFGSSRVALERVSPRRELQVDAVYRDAFSLSLATSGYGFDMRSYRAGSPECFAAERDIQPSHPLRCPRQAQLKYTYSTEAQRTPYTACSTSSLCKRTSRFMHLSTRDWPCDTLCVMPRTGRARGRKA